MSVLLLLRATGSGRPLPTLCRVHEGGKVTVLKTWTSELGVGPGWGQRLLAAALAEAPGLGTERDTSTPPSCVPALYSKGLGSAPDLLQPLVPLTRAGG